MVRRGFAEFEKERVVADEHGSGEIASDGYGLLVAAVMGTFVFCIILTIVLIIVTPP